MLLRLLTGPSRIQPQVLIHIQFLSPLAHPERIIPYFPTTNLGQTIRALTSLADSWRLSYTRPVLNSLAVTSRSSLVRFADWWLSPWHFVKGVLSMSLQQF